MFGTSGIRGPVGEVVTADLALAVGRALAADAARVVVGRDPRESGEFLTDALVAGLRESGTDVVDIGLAATPTVARAVAAEDAAAGVSITASHNPAPDNGIKLWNPSGQAFDEAQREAVTERIREEYFEPVGWEGLGTRIERDGAERHVQTLVDAVDLAEPLSVIVDVGNGAGGVTAEALARLGCEVETLNAQPDGRFPGRPSEPTAETCESLCQLVGASDADLGIAHDGDADRMMAVTGAGEFISGDILLALFSLDAAGAGERVAAPVDTSLVVADLLADQGASLTRTKVGDVYVAERATEPDVVFGGEPSGAWIWPEETLCPDGPLAAVRLVELASKRPLADRVGDIEPYPIRRTSLEVENKDELMAAIEARVHNEFDDVQTLDGVRVDLGDAWFLLRASGTQPLIRVTAEARDPGRADEVFERATGIVADSQ
ncbi:MULTISPECIES: phosphoglucosamine mutase [unclassified Haladaptatus]|uniref:phosphoglucosamine mutase n=1 Tax=unclassified Haladaptatus TaxID=2622732 RepID=UPI0023E8BE33|nr:MULTISPECIES: phosphoglucosamine mutase [unclassified Haladaptatus]